MNLMNKRWWVAVIVVAAVLVWAGVWYFNKPASHLFEGQLIKIVSAGELELLGTHIVDGDADSSDFLNPKTVRVKITPETRLTKVTLYFPSREELKASGGIWSPSGLRQEEESGSAADFENKSGLPIAVTTLKNVFNAKTFEASEIKYTIHFYPEELLPNPFLQ